MPPASRHRTRSSHPLAGRRPTHGALPRPRPHPPDARSTELAHASSDPSPGTITLSSELHHGVRLGAETLLRIACDAGLVVAKTSSERDSECPPSWSLARAARRRCPIRLSLRASPTPLHTPRHRRAPCSVPRPPQAPCSREARCARAGGRRSRTSHDARFRSRDRAQTRDPPSRHRPVRARPTQRFDVAPRAHARPSASTSPLVRMRDSALRNRPSPLFVLDASAPASRSRARPCARAPRAAP